MKLESAKEQERVQIERLSERAFSPLAVECIIPSLPMLSDPQLQGDETRDPNATHWKEGE